MDGIDMKIYISADIEGVTGVAAWDETDKSKPDYIEFREQMTAELRKEFGRLVTATTAQVTGKVLTDDDQRRINEEALAKVS